MPSPPPLHASTVDYVKNHINLYMRVFNTGDTAIDDIWISFPEDVEISVPTNSGGDFELSVFNIKRAFMPGESATIKFDGDYFFGTNISFAADQKHSFMLAFKNPKEQKYSVAEIPFQIREQEDNPEEDYTLGVENGIKVVEQGMAPYSREDFQDLPKK